MRVLLFTLLVYGLSVADVLALWNVERQNLREADYKESRLEALSKSRPRRTPHRFQKRLVSARPTNNTNAIGIAQHGMGRTFEGIGKLQEASRYYKQAVASMDSTELTLNDNSSQAAWFEDKMEAFESLLRVLHKLGKSTEAFNYIEQAKARDLLYRLSKAWTKTKYVQLNKTGQTATLNQLQHLLGEKTALIEYLITGEALYTLVIRKTTVSFIKTNTSASDIIKLIRSWRDDLSGAKRNTVYNFLEISVDLSLLRRLYEKIFLPLESHLSGCTHLIIIPDGPLHFLPFEALVTKIRWEMFDRKLNFSRYKNASYLIETYAVSYAPSASVLYHVVTRAFPGSDFKGDLLAIANPRADSQDPLLSPLPKAEATTKALRKMFPNCLIVTGRQATKKCYFENADAYKIIHLATHGIVNEDQPMDSKLFFAGEGEQREDASLHVYEILNRTLRAELLVLSACETGLGTLRRGEGVLGLARAFLCAGTPALVATLWSVEDSSNELISHFYANLKAGMRKSDALREAKLQMIRSIGRQGPLTFSYANPYLWAPFILIGDDEPIFPPDPNYKALLTGSLIGPLLIGLPFVLRKIIKKDVTNASKGPKPKWE